MILEMFYKCRGNVIFCQLHVDVKTISVQGGHELLRILYKFIGILRSLVET